MIIGLIIRHGIGKKVGKHRSLRSPNALRTFDRTGQRIKKQNQSALFFYGDPR